jgi:hypothetical protein
MYIRKGSSRTSSFQNLTVPLRTIGQRKCDDLIVSREFDLSWNHWSAPADNQALCSPFEATALRSKAETKASEMIG